jgi:hypothetical protein
MPWKLKFLFLLGWNLVLSNHSINIFYCRVQFFSDIFFDKWRDDQISNCFSEPMIIVALHANFTILAAWHHVTIFINIYILLKVLLKYIHNEMPEFSLCIWLFFHVLFSVTECIPSRPIWTCGCHHLKNCE